ncbi:MAG: hypothetical protein PHD51_02985 [Patescibacteria group bacterium]|nr:hypothetical protein [Patescibacteria group bacterium]MDD5490180.1 hypothetical protein [Patescibacteria group bacterium]
MSEKNIKLKCFKRIAIYVFAFFLLLGLFKVVDWVRAGSLNPTAAPATSMNSLEDVWNVVVGTYDSSAVDANANGSILEQLKDIKEGLGM